MARFQNREPQKSEPKGTYRRGPKNDAQVVPGFQLAAILRDWSKKWLADRPLNTKTGNRDETFIGPLDFLAHETEMSTRQISRIINEELEVVNFTTAEKLLMAIDREYLLAHEDVIQVVPNPHWSPEDWVAWMEKQRGCG